MRTRSLAAAFACAALALFGALVPVSAASAATTRASTADELAAAFAAAGDGDVLRVGADIIVGPGDDAIAVPANTTVTLDLNGKSLTIDAAVDHAGLEVGETSGLVIEDDAGSGELDVTGGDRGAGIGGSDEQQSGRVVIASGTIEATGGQAGAGIGGGRQASGGTTVIDGGTVTANGGRSGAGIGGGYGGYAGMVTISGGTVTANGSVDPDSGLQHDAAGIGGGRNAGSGEITITDGTVTATGSGNGAGIGGGGLSGGSNGGIITITGGAVNATGGPMGGAGIGSAAGRSAGPVIIEGGTVIATGGGGWRGGPGIGQGWDGEMTVSISGGTVTAIGGSTDDGEGAAGIGGASGRPGVPTTITGGTVVARGTAGGAGIGGGTGVSDFPTGGGSAVNIGADATVSVSAEDGGNAIGQGSLGVGFGSLSNAGALTIESGSTLTIPAEVTVTNSGTLTVDGAVVNNGTIVNTGTVANPDNVSVHHYLLEYELNGADPAPEDQRVFAATLAAAQLDVPAGPERIGYAFDGWYPVPVEAISTLAEDEHLTGTTVLGDGETAGADGPVTQTWQARWAEVAPPAWSGDAAAELTVGTEASVTFPVADAETVSQTSGTLPEGLTAEVTSTGVTIAGTPAAGTEGEYSLEYTATAAGQDAVLTVTLTVVEAATEPPPTPDPTEEPAAAPTATPNPEPTEVAAEDAPSEIAEASLPDTGANLALPVGIAIVLILGGITAAVIARRRGH